MGLFKTINSFARKNEMSVLKNPFFLTQLHIYNEGMRFLKHFTRFALAKRINFFKNHLSSIKRRSKTEESVWYFCLFTQVKISPSLPLLQTGAHIISAVRGSGILWRPVRYIHTRKCPASHRSIYTRSVRFLIKNCSPDHKQPHAWLFLIGFSHSALRRVAAASCKTKKAGH